MGIADNKFFAGVAGVAKAITRTGRAPEQIIIQRRQICVACPHQQITMAGKKCALCGCWTDLKTVNADQFCPATPPRWNAIP